MEEKKTSVPEENNTSAPEETNAPVQEQQTAPVTEEKKTPAPAAKGAKKDSFFGKIAAFAKKSTKKFVAMILAIVIVLGAAVGAIVMLTGNKNGGMIISNETTHLVLASQELDGVFNPFYSSSGPDGSVVGMTQIGMLSSDKEGKVAYGKDEACVFCHL